VHSELCLSTSVFVKFLPIFQTEIARSILAASKNSLVSIFIAKCKHVITKHPYKTQGVAQDVRGSCMLHAISKNSQ
jgi:hypothetical protein